MVIGVCTLDLMIHESQSLKDKRQVLKSVIERIQHRFNVSVSEIDHQDHWQLASIGVACLSNEARFSNEVLNKVRDLVERDARLEVIRCAMEML